MERLFCLIALLAATVACEQTGRKSYSTRTYFGPPTFTVPDRTATPVDVCKAVDQNDKLAVSKVRTNAINNSSAETTAPAGILNGHVMVESGGVLYGDPGKCFAYEQYQIMKKWRPEDGQANLDALEHIAKVTGRKIRSIRSSCGNYTMEKGGDEFGGAIGPAQIMARYWVADPVMRNSDPFSLCQAVRWIGRRDKQFHDSDKAGEFALAELANKPKSRLLVAKIGKARFLDYARWQYAIRKYYGSIKHARSEAYYLGVLAHWKKWYAATTKPVQGPTAIAAN